METDEWFKIKKYPHIGKPILLKDYKWVKKYVEDPERIRTHSFLPLIHKTVVNRKFRPTEENNGRNPSGKRIRIKLDPKIRDIYYSSHIDSQIYSKYNSILYDKYETALKKTSFENSVVSYRKIPILVGKNANKCNIDFAKDAFEFIRDNNSEDLSIIISDITSFFDNLDHKILKRQWANILGFTSLPADHYNIFKSITRLRYIDGEDLFNSVGKKVIVKSRFPNNPRKPRLVKKNIRKTEYFKEKNVAAFCTKFEFINGHLNLVISKNSFKGIPQGSPISATLANIYMMGFDKAVWEKVTKFKGFYQRYSDDLIIVCKRKYENEMITYLRENIELLAKLEIQEKKTKLYRLEQTGGKVKIFEIDQTNKKANYIKSLEYLGFSYDGNKVLIKTSGFSKFYRSMKRSFRKSTSLAINSKNPDRRIFKSRLYARFTYRGAKRKLIFQPSAVDKNIYKKTHRYYWGNYLTYVHKANDTFKKFNGSDSIRRQSRKFWGNFNQLMKYHCSRLPKS